MTPEQNTLLQELYVVKGSHIKMLMALHICGGSLLKEDLNECLIELGGHKIWNLSRPAKDMVELGFILITYAQVSRRKATYTLTARGAQFLRRMKN